MFVGYCSLFVVRCELCDLRCWLLVDFSLLIVGSLLLRRCLLFVGWLMLVDGCVVE